MVGKRRQQDSGYTPIWLTKPVQLLCESTVGCRHHMGRGPESWPEVAQEDGDMRPVHAGVEAVIWLLSTALLQTVRMIVRQQHSAMCSRAAWVPSLVAKAPRVCASVSSSETHIHAHTAMGQASEALPAQDTPAGPHRAERMASSKVGTRSEGRPISRTPGKLRHPTPLHGVSEFFPCGSHTCLRLSIQTAISPVP